jgi:N-acyl-D-amino-acid deacylase
MFITPLFLGLLGLSPAWGQTGVDVPALSPYDQFMTGLLRQTGIPGASLAVTRNGRLVFARGYGLADRETQTPVQPDSRFRIASLSKTITAVAVMRLVEEGKLSLDQPAFELLADVPALPGTIEDPRLAGITVRHLLQHSGGWDKSATFDPLHTSPQIAAALGVPEPVSVETMIQAMRSLPLQFTPGSRHCYSNFGYAVLGRIIERISGLSYEQYVRTHVLAPMGISQMRLGNTLAEGRLANEVVYYFSESGRSVFPDTPEVLPMQYGGRWVLDAGDAAGGWVASAIDFVKFLNGIDGRRGSRLLSEESVAAMTARSEVPEFLQAPAWYGLGLMVRPIGNGANWWHTGGNDGNLAFYARTASGYSWVVLFNASPKEEELRAAILAELDRGLSEAFTRVTNWPAADQFTAYPDTTVEDFLAMPAINTRDGVSRIVPGSLVSISGINFAPGVTVQIDNRDALVRSVSPSRIEVQAPDELAAGWVPVEVILDGVRSGVVLAHCAR